MSSGLIWPNSVCARTPNKVNITEWAKSETVPAQPLDHLTRNGPCSSSVSRVYFPLSGSEQLTFEVDSQIRWCPGLIKHSPLYTWQLPLIHVFLPIDRFFGGSARVLKGNSFFWSGAFLVYTTDLSLSFLLSSCPTTWIVSWDYMVALAVTCRQTKQKHNLWLFEFH